MKEAVGEANKTVITIILIAVIGGAGLILVPRMMNKMSENTCCIDKGGVWVDNKCYNASSCQINGSGKSVCDASGYIDSPCKVEDECIPGCFQYVDEHGMGHDVCNLCEDDY